MKRFLYILVFFLLLLPGAYAQDSLRVVDDNDDDVVRDTVLLKSYATRYNPRKALLYAAILPGLGQVYNKKYWKLPLVYGGFISIGYGFNFYQKAYKKYKGQLFYNLNQAPNNESFINPVSNATTAQLRRAVDRSQRERDFMTILMAGMYLLQIVDAHVDAHLKEFDLNPNLKVSIEPIMEQNSMIGRQTGVGLIVRF